MATKAFQLNELLDFQQKSHHKAGDGLRSGKYPFFTSSQQQTKWFDEADYRIESIILGTGGAPSIHCAKNFSTSTDVFILAPKNNNVSSKYICYFLRWDKDILERGFKGAGLKHLSRDYTQKIRIPLPIDDNGNPDIKEQERIVALLAEAEELKRKRAEADQKMNELIPALFVQMFGDPTENLKGWEFSPLNNYVKVKHGLAFQGEYFSEKGDYVLLTPGNFYEDGGYKNRGEKQKYYIGEIPHQYILKKDDLLIAMTEQAPGLLGSPLFVPRSNKFLHNQRLGLVIYEELKFNHYFLFHFFNHSTVRSLISMTATGTKVQHTSPSKIEQIKISIPPSNLQNQFAERVKEIETQKEKQKQSAIQLDGLFSSLLDGAFVHHE